MKSKTKLLPPPGAGKLVADGGAGIGVIQASEAVRNPAVAFVSPLAPELQVRFVVAAGAGARESDAAAALVKFLTSPAAAVVIRSKGMEPG